MTPPFARPIDDDAARPAGQRRPRAFAPDAATDLPATVEVLSETDGTFDPLVPPRKRSWPARIAWAAGGILITMALGLAAERLIADLFTTQPWLGWLGPIVMYQFLRYISGIPFTEQQALRTRGDDYRDYQRSTPMLFPWFPKH